MTKSPKTIQEMFQDYKKICYPDGMTENQEHQTFRAFCAGSLTMHHQMLMVAEMTPDDSEKFLSKISDNLADTVGKFCPADAASGVQIIIIPKAGRG